MYVDEQDDVRAVNIIYESMNKRKSVIDRDDITVPDPPLPSAFAVKHIQRLLNIRAAHKAPKAIITDMLKYIHEEFRGVDGIHELPTTWQKCEHAISHVKPQFIKVTIMHATETCIHMTHSLYHIVMQIDACPNECLLYRGTYANDDRCRKCGECRFEQDMDEFKHAHEIAIGRAVAQHVPIAEKKIKYKARYVYRYCPLIPRLKTLIAHPVLSVLLKYADGHMVNEDPNIADDIHQAPAYHKFAQHFPLFNSDHSTGICDYRIALGIGADRASMSKHKQRNDYAVLPILACIMNWPIWFRSKEKHLLTVGVPPLKSHNPSVFFGNERNALCLTQHLIYCVWHL